ncbi:hypothetical protein [Duganella sp. P38]|jgi:hypothetical protein|uniref:hypothetical protein n=1 Tax=Duganella sp. P38 TaxID=3423949 RepID=UPI003D7A71D7
MMIIGEFAFYLFMDVLMYSLGRLIIPIVSLGRARAVRTREIFSRNPMPPYADDGKMLIPEWGAAMAGVITLSLALSLYLALR